MLDRAIHSFLTGMKAALQLGALLLATLVMFPVAIIGLWAGIAWTGFLAGYRSTDDFLDWLTGDFRAWRIRLVRDGDSGEG